MKTIVMAMTVVVQVSGSEPGKSMDIDIEGPFYSIDNCVRYFKAEIFDGRNKNKITVKDFKENRNGLEVKFKLSEDENEYHGTMKCKSVELQ